MRGRNIRRVPVVDEGGGLIGILSLDDLLELLSEELPGDCKTREVSAAKEMKRRQ